MVSHSLWSVTIFFWVGVMNWNPGSNLSCVKFFWTQSSVDPPIKSIWTKWHSLPDALSLLLPHCLLVQQSTVQAGFQMFFTPSLTYLLTGRTVKIDSGSSKGIHWDERSLFIEENGKTYNILSIELKKGGMITFRDLIEEAKVTRRSDI